MSQARRLRRAASGAPVSAAIVVAMLLIAPVGLYRAGEAVGETLGAALADTRAASAFVVATALAAACVGALLVALVPGRKAFGALVEASPAGARDVVLAGAIVPVAVASLPLSLTGVAFLLPALGDVPGGSEGVAALAATVVATLAVGAALAECAIQVWRGRRSAAIGASAVCGGWLACGLTDGQPLLGPCGYSGRALAGIDGLWTALVPATLVFLAALLSWVALAPRRPTRRPRTTRPPLLRMGGNRTVIAIGVAAAVGRRHDLRRAIIAASLFGLAGTAVGRSMGLVEPLPLHLGAATVVLGAAAFPLAVPGALLEGRAMWWTAPRRRGVPWAATCVGAVALALAVAPLLALESMRGGQVGFGGVVVVVLLAATTAAAVGAVVPLRRDRVGDQLVSFAAFVAGGAAAGLGIGHMGSRLADAGVPDSMVASGAVALCFGIAGVAVAVRLERG